MVPSTRRHPVRCADGAARTFSWVGYFKPSGIISRDKKVIAHNGFRGAPSQASVNGTLFIEKGERSQSSNQDTEKRENSRKSDLIDDMFAFIGVRSEELDDAPLAVKVMDEAAQACHRH